MLKKRRKLERELGATPDPKALRVQGDLILAHLRLVKKGATEVTLPGFEDTPETIVLDPKLSPQGECRALLRPCWAGRAGAGALAGADPGGRVPRRRTERPSGPGSSRGVLGR